MALLVDKTLASGIKLESAYAKIGTIQGNKDYISFNLEYFYNEDLRIANKPAVFIEQYGFDYSIEDKCVFKKCYEYLKTLESFKAAIDVME